MSGKSMLDQAKKISEIIRDLILARFYGSVLIKFEAGKIVHVKKEESIRLE
jgi:hypothetical protein